MVFECNDKDLINGLANHPDVIEALDLEEGELALYDDQLNNSRLLFLVADTLDAMCILEFKGPDIWEIHSFFLKSARGRRGIQIGKEVLSYMENKKYAHVIWGQTPMKLRGARLFNKWCGMESAGYGVLPGVGPVEYFRVIFKTK